MRRGLLFIAFVLGFCNTTHAQDSTDGFQLLVFPYMNGDVGKSTAIAGQMRLSNKLFVNAGIKFHHNRLHGYPKINNEKFHHRFFAANNSQKIGLSAGLRYVLPQVVKIATPYVYYDLSAFNMDIRYQYLPDSGVNTGNPVPFYNFVYKNAYSIENGLGLGITSAVFTRLYLNIRAGGAANLIFNLPKAGYRSGVYANPSYQFAIGAEYRF
jgi:hypothetical protein